MSLLSCLLSPVAPPLLQDLLRVDSLSANPLVHLLKVCQCSQTDDPSLKDLPSQNRLSMGLLQRQGQYPG